MQTLHVRLVRCTRLLILTRSTLAGLWLYRQTVFRYLYCNVTVNCVSDTFTFSSTWPWPGFIPCPWCIEAFWATLWRHLCLSLAAAATSFQLSSNSLRSLQTDFSMLAMVCLVPCEMLPLAIRELALVFCCHSFIYLKRQLQRWAWLTMEAATSLHGFSVRCTAWHEPARARG